MSAATLPLTVNEAAVLKAVPTFQYVDGQPVEDGLQIWTWSFTDDAATAAGMSLRAVKGVLSSLSKKGLIVTDNAGVPADERCTMITAKGAEVVAYLQDAPVAAAPRTFTPKRPWFPQVILAADVTPTVENWTPPCTHHHGSELAATKCERSRLNIAKFAMAEFSA